MKRMAMPAQSDEIVEEDDEEEAEDEFDVDTVTLSKQEATQTPKRRGLQRTATPAVATMKRMALPVQNDEVLEKEEEEDEDGDEFDAGNVTLSRQGPPKSRGLQRTATPAVGAMKRVEFPNAAKDASSARSLHREMDDAGAGGDNLRRTLRTSAKQFKLPRD